MQCSFLGWGNHLECTLLLGWWRGGHRWISKTGEQLCTDLNAEVVPSLVYFIWAVWWILEIFMQTRTLLPREDKVLETFPGSIWWASFPSVALCCGQTSTQSCQVSHIESLSRSLASQAPPRRLPLSLPLRSSGRLYQSGVGSPSVGQSSAAAKGKCCKTTFLGVIGLSCLAARLARTPGAGGRALFILAWKDLKEKHPKSGISRFSVGGEGQEGRTSPLHCYISHFEAEHRHPGSTQAGEYSSADPGETDTVSCWTLMETGYW